MAEFPGLGSLDVNSAKASASALVGDPKDYSNREEIEIAWAIKSYQYAETHMKLIQSVDAKGLKLTKHDDELYEKYMKSFADLKIDVLNQDDIKSEEAKALWRPFCNHFEGKIDDFNFGTLLRLDVSKDYTDENTVLVPRVQFLAIEIARNRSGLNTQHFISKK